MPVAAGVSGTATDASKVGVNGASAGPSGRKLAPGAIAGIVVVSSNHSITCLIFPYLKAPN